MGWEVVVVIVWVSVTSEKGQQAWPDTSELPTLWQWLNTLSGSHSRKIFTYAPNMFSVLTVLDVQEGGQVVSPVPVRPVATSGAAAGEVVILAVVWLSRHQAGLHPGPELTDNVWTLRGGVLTRQ